MLVPRRSKCRANCAELIPDFCKKGTKELLLNLKQNMRQFVSVCLISRLRWVFDGIFLYARNDEQQVRFIHAGDSQLTQSMTVRIELEPVPKTTRNLAELNILSINVLALELDMENQNCYCGQNEAIRLSCHSSIAVH